MDAKEFDEILKQLILGLIGENEKELEYYECGKCHDADVCHFEKETWIELQRMNGRNELRNELRAILREGKK
jgi:hypothetical protein